MKLYQQSKKQTRAAAIKCPERIIITSLESKRTLKNWNMVLCLYFIEIL